MNPNVTTIRIMRLGLVLHPNLSDWLCVANATVCFNASSRTGGRDTFLCADKENYPKEIRPMPLASCALAVLSRFAGRDSCPSSKVRHPCRTPSGYSRQNRQCSARHDGNGCIIVGWIRRASTPWFKISNNFLRVVIHHIGVHHIRWITPHPKSIQNGKYTYLCG